MSYETPATAGGDPELREARRLALDNRLDEAERVYRTVLAKEPCQQEALRFLGMRAMQAGIATTACELLQRAVALAPDDPDLLQDAGVALLATGRLPDAIAMLRRALEIRPTAFASGLYLGHALERSGACDEALREFFRAVTGAQLAGRWLNEASTPPALRANVKYAMQYIDGGRRQLFGAVLAPLRAQYGAEALRRVEHGLAIYLGDAPRVTEQSLQRAKYLFVPGLPAKRYFDRALFPFLEQLENQYEAIRTEALSVLEAGAGREPFLRLPSAAHADAYLHGSRGPPAWDAYFFFRHGERYEDNCARCPTTAAMLETLPLVRVPRHAPEICFSLLTSGTHILPHHGVTNTRVVAHVPLIVPDNCALRVGGEERAWTAGQCVIFDDTFEHEAWNRSESNRVVLILDLWNPHLDAAERAALTELVAAIGDFNRETRPRGPLSAA